jgi:hypothetical protein
VLPFVLDDLGEISSEKSIKHPNLYVCSNHRVREAHACRDIPACAPPLTLDKDPRVSGDVSMEWLLSPHPPPVPLPLPPPVLLRCKLAPIFVPMLHLPTHSVPEFFDAGPGTNLVYLHIDLPAMPCHGLCAGVPRSHDWSQRLPVMRGFLYCDACMLLLLLLLLSLLLLLLAASMTMKVDMLSLHRRFKEVACWAEG